MKKLVEHTYGSYAFMRLELEGEVEEISVFWREGGETYETSADADPERRAAIIKAFYELY